MDTCCQLWRCEYAVYFTLAIMYCPQCKMLIPPGKPCIYCDAINETVPEGYTPPPNSVFSDNASGTEEGESTDKTPPPLGKIYFFSSVLLCLMAFGSGSMSGLSIAGLIVGAIVFLLIDISNQLPQAKNKSLLVLALFLKWAGILLVTYIPAVALAILMYAAVGR